MYGACKRRTWLAKINTGGSEAALDDDGFERGQRPNPEYSLQQQRRMLRDNLAKTEFFSPSNHLSPSFPFSVSLSRPPLLSRFSPPLAHYLYFLSVGMGRGGVFEMWMTKGLRSC